MNWATEHVVLRDIQRLAQRRLAETGSPRFCGFFIDLPPKVADAYLQATVPGFEYPRRDLPASVRFVGPILAPPSTRFDRPLVGRADGGRPVVHVTQGTLDNADLGRLLRPTIEALAGDDLLVVATTGGPDPAPCGRGLPANVRLERFIPHDLLLPHVDVMVTNGGYGGVQQALAHGVPLVVAGDSEDKPEVAARVHWSGTGIDLRTGRPSPAQVAGAVRRVLAEPAYRDGRPPCGPRSPAPTRSAPSAPCCPSSPRRADTTRSAEPTMGTGRPPSAGVAAEEDAMIERVVAQWHCLPAGGSCLAGWTSCCTTTSSSTRPIVFTPEQGKAVTKLYLEAAGQTLPGEQPEGSRHRTSTVPPTGRFRYTKTVLDGDTAVLEVRDDRRGKVRQRRRHHPLRRRRPHHRVPGDDPALAGGRPSSTARWRPCWTP